MTSRDELLRLLDLSGEHTSKPASLSITPSPLTPPTSELSPTALRVDGWGLRQGQEALAESERLRGLGLDGFAVADFLAAAFEPDPQLLPTSQDALRHAFLTQMLQMPDYHALHTSTALQQTASLIAATAFAERFIRFRDEPHRHPDRRHVGTPEKEDELEGEMAALRAAGEAVRVATEAVDELQEATAAMGMGPGCPGSNDPNAIAALFRRVRSDPTLRRICTLAGRFRRVAQSRQRQKSTHGNDEVVGVTLSGDLSRLLPAELARLAVPEMEFDTLRRLLERQCLSRDMRSKERVAKGPVLITVDESGSMAGDKVHAAKALALALAWIARKQKRWCGLIAFSGNSGHRLLTLPPRRWDEHALADWLTAFIGKGSDLDVPLRELPDFYRQMAAPVGKTDVVMLTDALCHVPTDVQQRFLAWKRQVKARVVALVIRERPGDLEGVCDECHVVQAIDPIDDAIGRVLSF